ncbi:hypothetical protein BCR32DRAFT_275488 [Anaeromyces robustus]|uniref:Uncharacterized protein n=1 Tax=Anaeromyces robustus TaxID=1754192 RepID=A0A1Y1XKT3_9FUNG|nr:hypothetical protein BCR32DRAFT_275488 [Anaeromyces robustus]|eukprot:ORX86379.1 hypothetical protein BCR32DRAFT_275488 [Anaeromyces robustus]
MKFLVLLLILINIIVGIYGKDYKTKDTCEEYRKYLSLNNVQFLNDVHISISQEVDIPSNSTLYKEINDVSPNTKLCEDGGLTNDDIKITCHSEEKTENNNNTDSYPIRCNIEYPNPNKEITSTILLCFAGLVLIIIIVFFILANGNIIKKMKHKKRNNRNRNRNYQPYQPPSPNNNNNNNNNDINNVNDINNNGISDILENNNREVLPEYNIIDVNIATTSIHNNDTNNSSDDLPTYDEVIVKTLEQQ